MPSETYRPFFIVVIFSFASFRYIAPHKNNPHDLDEILDRYWQLHLSKDVHYREVRDCQHIKYGNVTHSKTKAHGFNDGKIVLPIVNSHHTRLDVGEYSWNKKHVQVHYAVINNPYQTMSVLEPLKPETCGEKKGVLATVKKSAEQRNCLLAINAGFFNTTSFACFGNLVSDGRLVLDSGGLQNAHFGITKDGHIFIGYLSEIDLVAQDFIQLVGGMIWLVRDGEVYVKESKNIECPEIEETGTTETFVNVISARTAVGVDKEGKVVIVQVDGQSFQQGVDLYEFAKILVDFGVVNAINLDGGGSATFVINNTVVNYPSDTCIKDKRFRCSREVSTILCAHVPDCTPRDCSGHGHCSLGVCKCDYPWSGSACDTLKCDCSDKGTCSPAGCICEPGWHGINCSQPCLHGYYGVACRHQCLCLHGAGCNPVDGTCYCTPGYTGPKCEKTCPFGLFGNHCKSLCMCDKGCPCHHISGSCQFDDLSKEFVEGGQCYANNIITEKKLVRDRSDDYRLMQVGFITLGIIAAVSVLANTILSYKLFTSKKPEIQYKPPKHKKSRQLYLFNNATSTDDELSSLSDYPMAETSFITQDKRGTQSNHVESKS